ncbi:murein L,D-transpeptidase family protein [Comamonas sp.]|uniref:L,D-transpeptidase family protein n=1 Tax=Comamonas sp. TaxID=34028 RepID=UPI00258FE79F|nr:L,D-transpeptidase [Comamonas sp.]
MPNRRKFLAQALLAGAGLGLPLRQVNAGASDASFAGALLSGVQRDSPEARLIGIYRAIAAGDSAALDLAHALVRDMPRFQLGQLVYGDLLLTRSGKLNGFSSAADITPTHGKSLQLLHEEAWRRLQWLRETPEPGLIPRQLVRLASNVRHLIAVDASHSRVYVFMNTSAGLELIRSFYASIGQGGFDKQVEGDLRTPLGVYFITSRLEEIQLQEIYGIGALPLNYPNEHDRRLGRTGSGIWLHGVPRTGYARSPYSTEGCVALANDDMAYLMHTLQLRRTPVIIANELHWVHPDEQATERNALDAVLSTWRQAHARGDIDTLSALQTPDYNARTTQPAPRQASATTAAQAGIKEVRAQAQVQAQWRNVSVFRWKHQGDVAIVNYTTVSASSRARSIDRRQYWSQDNGHWRLFFDGMV